MCLLLSCDYFVIVKWYFCSNDNIEQRVKINGQAPAQIFLGSNFSPYIIVVSLLMYKPHILMLCAQNQIWLYCSYNCDVCGNRILGICVANYIAFQGLTDMWTSILSLASNSTFHDLKCLKRECHNCGIGMSITYLDEEDKRNEKIIHGKTRAGLDNMVVRLQYKEAISQVFLSYARPRL